MSLYVLAQSVRTLTGILPGVIGKLVKHEAQLRTEVVTLINDKLRTSLPMLSV